MYDDDDKPKKGKGKKPGQWSPLDILLGIGGLIIIGALTIAAFKTAKWVIATYF